MIKILTAKNARRLELAIDEARVEGHEGGEIMRDILFSTAGTSEGVTYSALLVFDETSDATEKEFVDDPQHIKVGTRPTYTIHADGTCITYLPAKEK